MFAFADEAAATPLARNARIGYAILAWGFLAAVVAQVALAGVAVFSDAAYWAHHTSFVHVFEGLPLLMLVLAFLGKSARFVKWGAFAAFFFVGLQYGLAHMRPDVTAGLHVVNALFVFWLAVELAKGARLD